MKKCKIFYCLCIDRFISLSIKKVLLNMNSASLDLFYPTTSGLSVDRKPKPEA